MSDKMISLLSKIKLVLIFWGFFVSIGLSQDHLNYNPQNKKTERQTISTLSIPCVVRIIIADTVWKDFCLPEDIPEKWPIDRPRRILKKLSVETNCSPIKIFLETISKKGNLKKGLIELLTYYQLLPEFHSFPQNEDPNWKNGRELKSYIKNIEEAGKKNWFLHVKVVSEGNLSSGVYTENLNCIVIDKFGQTHIKQFTIELKIEKVNNKKKKKRSVN